MKKTNMKKTKKKESKDFILSDDREDYATTYNTAIKNARAGLLDNWDGNSSKITIYKLVPYAVIETAEPMVKLFKSVKKLKNEKNS